MFKEFKEFALKGNMIDLAVGIVIGGAFGTVVKSLVDDVIMPIISGFLNLPDFSNLFVVLKNPTAEHFTSLTSAREAGAAVLAFGNFINAFLAFLIVAFALFMIIKGINKLKRKQEASDKPVGPTEIELLTQIRDGLRK
jgi:large conductance mechanosensitive channel